MHRIDDVIDIFLERRGEASIARIQRAYIFSAKQHEGQLRKSGEPYMTHPVGVAAIIAKMGLDEPSICAALLHDTLEDTDASFESLVELFGDDVAVLVDGVTKLSTVNFTKREERQAESFRKLLVAMANDIRVLIVKLADRLHNMRTLEYMSPRAQERIAQETRDIYAPLAHRLGISWLRAELDDLAFKHLESTMHKEIEKYVEQNRDARQIFIEHTIQELKDFLESSGFQVKISGRSKNFYSIYKKMQMKGVGYEEVHDAIAFRVICKSVPDCYAILGLVHSRWVPVPGRFKDYVAMPRPNNYQSLHTTVVGVSGERVEIQIRTEEMHRVAEYGIAAHWLYKEGKGVAPSTEGFSWLREMLENQDEVRDSSEFYDSIKVDLFRDEVFVFTPRGDVKSLGRGATPLDFAYAIHTEVGNRCTGARVNGVQVPLRTELKNGDMVEVVTSKTQRPSPDWMDIVATSRARTKIRTYLRAEQRKQSRIAGHDILEKSLRRYGYSYNKLLKLGKLEETAGDLKFGNLEDMAAAIGYGKLDKDEVLERLFPDDKRIKSPSEVKEQPLEKDTRKNEKEDGGIVLDGLDNLLVRFARCCNPLPGEDIMGYVSRGRGIVIHRRGCSRAAMLDPERQTAVQWSSKAVSQRPVQLKVTTTNRTGVLATLSTIFQSHDIGINSAQCSTNGHNQGVCLFTFMVVNLKQLNRLIRSLRQAKDVLDVMRLQG